MKCTSCNAENSNEVTFCGQCGQKIDKVETVNSPFTVQPVSAPSWPPTLPTAPSSSISSPAGQTPSGSMRISSSERFSNAERTPPFISNSSFYGKNTPPPAHLQSSTGTVNFLSSPAFFELSGIGLLLSALLFIVTGFMGFFVSEITDPLRNPYIVMVMLGNFLLLVGLPGLHLKQANQTGWLGHIGVGIFIIGLLLAIIGGFADMSFTNSFLNGQLTEYTFTSGLNSLHGVSIATTLLQFIGGVLLGIAMLRAHMYHRVASVLLIILSISILGGLITDQGASTFFNCSNAILSAVVFAWLGYVLLPKRAIYQQ